MAGGVIPLYSAGQLVFTHTYIYGIIHLLKHTESCVQQKKSIALRHIRAMVLWSPYAFSKLRENAVLSRAIRQQTASEKSDIKL